MKFDSTKYGAAVAGFLSLDGDGLRPMPLVIARSGSDAARNALERVRAADLFPDSASPEAALSGLWLYFGFFDQSHSISQDLGTPEGSYWHGILHRQEPDAGNAGYWFRRVGNHPIFPDLLQEARKIIGHQYKGVRFTLGSEWNPFEFIDFCERARRNPGSTDEQAATEIQLAEWQLLFDYCARRRA